MPDIHIGEAGVLKLLNNINSHKATGPDGIPARLLHEYASHIAPALYGQYALKAYKLLKSERQGDSWMLDVGHLS
jgi:hypothetical protein